MSAKKHWVKSLQGNWEGFANSDPEWAILSCPGKKNNRWNRKEFFHTGRTEISATIGFVNSLGLRILPHKALDFGCGIGRLTQALTEYFDQVVGVDISATMLELAEKYSKSEDQCRFVLCETGDLRIFPDNTFDFIYSNITLQHNRPKHAEKYIREFCRILMIDGILVFQIPSEPVKTLKGYIMRWLATPFLQPVWNLYRRIKNRSRSVMEMHGIRKEKVIAILEDSGVTVRAIRDDNATEYGWIGYQYVCKKN